jgi:hypothetical protein
MRESKRLKGLETLRSFGLPTPDWREVRSTEHIARLRLTDTPYGWTIRTCRSDGQRETGGFFMNHVPAGQVPDVLCSRSDMFDKGEFYIVYPSWKFLMSFNVVFDDSVFIVEGKYGSQKGISDGTEMPDISVQIPVGARSQTTVYIGEYPPSLQSRVARTLAYLRRVPLRRYYSEVAITSKQQVFFYEFFPIGS